MSAETVFPLLKKVSVLWEPFIEYLNQIPDFYREAIYYELRDLEPGESSITFKLYRQYDNGDFLVILEKTFTHLTPSLKIRLIVDDKINHYVVSWDKGTLLIPSEINPHFTMAHY